VALLGSCITKEKEQGLAGYLVGLGYATLTIDPRNLGAINIIEGFAAISHGHEPIDHKMVTDVLSAAQVLRSLPEINADKVAYVGESNGVLFVVMACALDPTASGVVAISTCGYGADEITSSGSQKGAAAIQFYRPIDPEIYLSQIQPGKLVMIHSMDDPTTSYNLAFQIYSKALGYKEPHIIDRVFHATALRWLERSEKG